MLVIQNPRYQIDLEEDNKKGNKVLNPKRSKGKKGNKEENQVFKYSVESKEHSLESMESNASVDLIDSQIGRDYTEYKGRPRKTKCRKGKKNNGKNKYVKCRKQKKKKVKCNKRCMKKREERENRSSSSKE